MGVAASRLSEVPTGQLPVFRIFLQVPYPLTPLFATSKTTVIVADVRKDPRYLTAFGSTLSEIIVPILDPQSGTVIGTIDVESERADAFSVNDQKLLEECAQASLPLWSRD